MTQKQDDISKNFLKLGKLGQGTFGVVQRVLRIADNQQYALKTVRYQDLKEKNKKNALNEVSMLSEIEHPNIIRFKCAFFDSETKSLCTLMELAPNGDLASRIKQKIQNYQHFSEQQIWAIGRDIIHGIQALHKKNIIHRDIKPANILFGEADVAKIGDLNVSVKMNNDDIYLTNQTGTPYYASPEVWSNELYSFDCDVWSFGCVIYELCTLNKPFEGKNLDRLYRRIIRLKYDPIPYRYSSDLSDVIESCLQNRNKRISVESLKRIFDLHNKPAQVKQNTDTIKSPLSLYNYRSNTEISIEDQFAPKSPFCGYLNLNPEQKIELNTETSISSRKCVLDKYLKPERKLPSSRYYQSPKSVMSLKYLPPYRQPLELIERPQIRQLSFLRSPLKSPAYPQNLEPLHHHFRNRRARLQYF